MSINNSETTSGSGHQHTTGSLASGILDYPVDFFGKDGFFPRNPEEAATMWQCRKDHPQANEMEMKPANGNFISLEVINMKRTLKTHI